MKKIISMVIVFLALMAVSAPALATNEKADLQKTEQLTEETAFDEEAVDPDDLLEVCPKCGKKHDGCCDAEWIHVSHYGGSDLKFCDVRGNTFYFVTPENKLMLMNLKTKELNVIADNVLGLIRSGMNGRYLSFVTSKGDFINVPYEIDESGKLITEFQVEFGE